MTRIPGRRWAYCGALLGGAVSIAANVAHSYVPPPGASTGWSPELGAVVGAVFWPVALFVAIEILARVAWPAGTRWLWLRFGGLVPVAAVAAVVSYRHLSGLLAYYREDGLTVLIGPLAVDGLMVMATAALIATSRKSRDLIPPDEAPDEPAAEPVGDPWRYAVPVVPDPAAEPAAGPAPALPADPVPEPPRAPIGDPVRDLVSEPVNGSTSATVELPRDPVSEPVTDPTRGSTGPTPEPVREPVRRPRRDPAKQVSRKRPRTTAERVATAHAKHPDVTHKRLADLLKVSESTVKRHRPGGPPEPAGESVNGRVPTLTRTTSERSTDDAADLP